MSRKETLVDAENPDSLVHFVRPAVERVLWPFLPVDISSVNMIPGNPDNILKYLTLVSDQYPDALNHGGTLSTLIKDVRRIYAIPKEPHIIKYYEIIKALNEFVPQDGTPEQNLPFGLLVSLYFGTDPSALAQIEGLTEDPTLFKKRLMAGETHLVDIFNQALLHPYFDTAVNIGAPDPNPLAQIVLEVGTTSIRRALRFNRSLEKADIMEITRINKAVPEQAREQITDELMNQLTRTSLFSPAAIVPNPAIFRLAGKRV